MQINFLKKKNQNCVAIDQYDMHIWII